MFTISVLPETSEGIYCARHEVNNAAAADSSLLGYNQSTRRHITQDLKLQELHCLQATCTGMFHTSKLILTK